MRKAARCGNNSSTQHPKHDHVTQAAEPSRHAHMISDRTTIRDGVVANRPVYRAIGIDCEGAKMVLGLWVGPTTGESAKFWLSVLAELKGRGVAMCASCAATG